MTRASGENVVEVQPVPGIYTALMIVAVLALWIGIGFSLVRLMSKVPTSNDERGGYGLTMGDLFNSSDPEDAEK
ncbi:MAG: hypothetical protein KAR11_00910 [Phycisphaerae bacterium]|nr:hypothetical protein [Phycisphaerae bacterium]